MAVGILIGIVLASVRLMGAHFLLFHAQTPSSHDQVGAGHETNMSLQSV